MLDDEERGDVELRNQFKERWTRTPSSTLTAPLRAEVKKYMDIIQNAITADKVVQEKFRANRDALILLSKQTVRRKSLDFDERLSSSTRSRTNFLRRRRPARCATRIRFANFAV